MMPRFYFSSSTHFTFLGLIFVTFVIGLPLISFLFLCAYLGALIILRRSKNLLQSDSLVREGMIYAPINGKVVSVRSHSDHLVFGRDLIEIRLALSWWDEMGLFLPLDSEVRDLVANRGRSYFRLKKSAFPVQDKKMLDGLSLILSSKRGEKIGLQFLKCPFGLWPEVVVMPGDKGKRRSNIGYFPFGGTVLLYLPQNYEILVNAEDKLEAGQTLIGSIASD